jgi:hypothetical protein
MGTKVFDNALDLLTFSRASGGTSLRKISYGSELVTNGTFDTDTTGWTNIGAGGTIEAFGGTLKINRVTAGLAAVYEIAGLTIGATYTLYYDLVSGAHRVDVSPSGGSVPGVGIFPPGLNSFVASATTMYLRFSINSGNGTSVQYDNISVKEVLFDQPDGTLTLFNHPNNIPRIEYAADGTVKGLLIEEQRTNRFANSYTFSDWVDVRSNIALNTDGVNAPDGSVSYKLTCDATASNTHIMQRNSATAAANSVACASVFVKKADDIVSHIQLRLVDDPAGASNIYTIKVNLTNGSVTDTGTQNTVTNPFNSVQDFGDGWYRINLGFTKNNTAIRTDLQIALATKGAISGVVMDAFNGDETSGAYIFGAVLEEGSFPTSYIPTEGIAKTRSADIASIPVTDFGYNQKAGTFLMEFNTTSAATVSAQYVLAAGNNCRVLYSNAGSSAWYAYDGANASTYTSPTPFTFSSTPIKAAYADAGNGASVYHSGVAGAPSSTSSLFGKVQTSNKYDIGSLTGSQGHLNGHIKSINYYPRRLTNTQLQELTS